jgi:hypothetical protein
MSVDVDSGDVVSHPRFANNRCAKSGPTRLGLLLGFFLADLLFHSIAATTFTSLASAVSTDPLDLYFVCNLVNTVIIFRTVLNLSCNPKPT